MIDQAAGGAPGQSGGTSAKAGRRTSMTAAERPVVADNGPAALRHDLQEPATAWTTAMGG